MVWSKNLNFSLSNLFDTKLGRTYHKVEASNFGQPDVKSRLIGKDHDAQKDWGQEEKGMTEDEVVGWHHRLDEHEFGKPWKIVKDREVCHLIIHGVTELEMT